MVEIAREGHQGQIRTKQLWEHTYGSREWTHNVTSSYPLASPANRTRRKRIASHWGWHIYQRHGGIRSSWTFADQWRVVTSPSYSTVNMPDTQWLSSWGPRARNQQYRYSGGCSTHTCMGCQKRSNQITDHPSTAINLKNTRKRRGQAPLIDTWMGRSQLRFRKIYAENKEDRSDRFFGSQTCEEWSEQGNQGIHSNWACNHWSQPEQAHVRSSSLRSRDNLNIGTTRWFAVVTENKNRRRSNTLIKEDTQPCWKFKSGEHGVVQVGTNKQPDASVWPWSYGSHWRQGKHDYCQEQCEDSHQELRRLEATFKKRVAGNLLRVMILTTMVHLNRTRLQLIGMWTPSSSRPIQSRLGWRCSASGQIKWITARSWAARSKQWHSWIRE